MPLCIRNGKKNNMSNMIMMIVVARFIQRTKSYDKAETIKDTGHKDNKGHYDIPYQ